MFASSTRAQKTVTFAKILVLHNSSHL